MSSKIWLGSIVLIAAMGSVAYAVPNASVPAQDFGEVRVANAATLTASRTFNVTNTGNQDLVIDTVALGGMHPGDFAITTDNASGQTLPPDATRSITVRFNPTAAGARDATLVITSNDPQSPTSSALTGVGTSAVIAVTDLAFGAVPVGGTGTGTVTVSNSVTTDQGPLRVMTATIAGGNWFTFDTNAPASCLNQTSCTFNIDVPPAKDVGVRCRPPSNATGSQNATVTFTSDTDPGGDNVAALSCTAGRPDIDLVTTSVAFGDVPINPSTPPTMTVTVGNTGAAVLTFTATEASPLYTLGGCSASCDVPAGETRDFTITFNPTAPTIPNANINVTITSNDLDETPLTVPVTGRGVAGVLAVSVPPGGGTSINFGNVPVDTVATRAFTLSNTGNLAVDNLAAVVNPSTVGYSIDPATPVPTTLAAGTSVSLTARFAPLTASDGGPASITFTGGSGATPPQTTAVLTLDGDGRSAGFTLSETTIDFGDLRFDTTPTRTFCITNPNETTLDITTITIAPGTGTVDGEFTAPTIRRPATCGGAGTIVTLPETLATGQLLEVTVRADPANRVGAMQATLTVTSNLTVNPTRSLSLLGNSTSGAFALDPGATIDFGAVDVQAQPVSRTVKITNTGDGPLDLTGFLVPVPDPQFTLTVPGDTTLQPAQSLDITVTYKPDTASPVGSEEQIQLQHAVAGAINGPAFGMITFRGRGIDRTIDIAATPMFPDTFRNPGDLAPVRAARIRNLGEVTLRVTTVMLDNSAGVWELLDASPVDIPRGASQEFLVRFSPKTAGRVSAKLLIMSDDTKRAAISIDLVGNGIDRSVQVAPATIRLGYTGVGVPVTVEGALVVTSLDAGSAFQIRAIELDEGSPFTIEGATEGLELAPLAERRFTLTFTPQAQGQFTAKARLFLDMDPVAQHEITIEGTAVFVDAHGGGGCAAGGSAGSGGVTVALALAALLGLRRRRRAPIFAAAALALAPAAASADDIVLSVFDPVPATTSNGFQLQSPDVGKRGDWVLSAVTSIATDPLILDGISGGNVVGEYAVISRSIVTNVGTAIAFLGRFEAGARLPIYVQDGQPAGDPSQGFTGQPAEGSALGDAALHAKVRFVRKRLEGGGAFSAGLGAQLTLPTATRDRFTGVENPSGRVQLLGALTPGAFERRLTLTMNLGGVIRARSTFANLEQKSGVAWGLGMSVRTLDELWLAGEVYGDTVPGGRADEMAQAQVLSPIEWLAGLHWKPDRRFTVGLAREPVGTPAFRGVLSLTLTPGAPELRPIRVPKPDGDADGDGIRDSVDRCRTEPEDVDLFDDTDGCPDPDNDGDRIADAQDRCPIEAEDKDGFLDDDGCVDKDNDGDGIADKNDRCPMEAEDKDRFLDTDGCPDPDNDRDGIVDAKDRCPANPETINGKDDDDGCPDKGDSLIVLSPDRIETLEAIQFTAGHKIAKASHNVLGQVGATLRARTEIARVRITVHVQPTDDDARDQESTDQRAAAVREWLVQWGVAPGRLEVRGFGGTKPLVPPERKGAAALNQRVELIILERK